MVFSPDCLLIFLFTWHSVCAHVYNEWSNAKIIMFVLKFNSRILDECSNDLFHLEAIFSKKKLNIFNQILLWLTGQIK